MSQPTAATEGSTTGQPRQTRRGRGRPRRDEPLDTDLGPCLICNTPMTYEDSNEVSSGLPTVIKASKKNKDNLDKKLSGKTAVRLHTVCRSNYTHERNKGKEGSNIVPAAPLLRSSNRNSAYVSETHCLLCTERIDWEKLKKAPLLRRKKKDLKFHCVEKLTLEDTLKTAIANRGTHDEWGGEVETRLNQLSRDLPAAEVKYHERCYIDFILLRSPGEKQRGRPSGSVDPEGEAMFKRLCEYLDNDDECQYSLSELVKIIEENGGKPYSKEWLKAKLLMHYENAVFITESCGKDSIVNFTGFVNDLLYEKWYKEKLKNTEDEKRRIVKLAAQFVIEEIRRKTCSMDEYPDPNNPFDQSMPELLQYFLQFIITSKSANSEIVNKKREFFGQALILACRPKSYISPLLLGLASALHREFGSRLLIDKIAAMGVFHSYHEARRYVYNETRAASRREEENAVEGDGFVQYGWDNGDWNTGTLDGRNTFHCLAGCRMTTPAPERTPGLVPRLPLPATAAEIVACGHFVPIVPYFKPRVNGLSNFFVRRPVTRRCAVVTAAFTKAQALDSLWMTGRWAGVPRSPSWCGYMRTAMTTVGTVSVHRTGVEALPFINLDPTNRTTLNSALLYSARDSKKRGYDEYFVTFDNGLFEKAVEIVKSDETGELKGCVVRLGGFHLVSNFMGCIGRIMSGSGLDDIWCKLYAPASVVHMMTGKAYARALRAHFLTQEALGTLLLDSDHDLDEATKTELCATYTDFLDHKMSPDEAAEKEVVQRLVTSINTAGERAIARGRTGQLWWLYYNLVALVRLFVRAERIGDWDLHLHAVGLMEPFFHAAAHHNYAKSTRMYLQMMEDLEGALKDAARDGFFTVRRCLLFWAGVWTDMVMEQDIMRPLKAQGGLTRGRGLTDSVLAQWVGSMPAMHRVCTTIEKFCGVFKTTSEQHVDMRPARQDRDKADLKLLVSALQSYKPYDNNDGMQIRCISTGTFGSDKVNCEKAEAIGLNAIEKMIGSSFSNLHLKRADRVTPIGEPIPVNKKASDPNEPDQNATFTRMVCLGPDDKMLQYYLKHELAELAPSLFQRGLMRHNAKSHMLKKFDCPAEEDPDDPLAALAITSSTGEVTLPVAEEVTVLDGGFLLHYIGWPKNTKRDGNKATYRDVCLGYCRYVTDNYGKKGLVEVVFDGYEVRWSTKSEEHRRRQLVESTKAKKPCPNIDVDDDTELQHGIDRDHFLGNTANKTRLIKLLSWHLRTGHNIEVTQADADADRPIAEAALRHATSPQRRVTVVANDTDILAGLIATATDQVNIIVKHPGTGKMYDVAACRRHQGEMTDCILVAHALSGCDTTSAMFNIGKNKLYELLEKEPTLREHAREFNKEFADKDHIAECGEKLILQLYGGGAQTLDQLRFYRLNEKMRDQSKKKKMITSFNLASLPPTSAAARQHSYRVYLEVQKWLGNDLCPTDWGWSVRDGTLVPLASTLPMAPAELLDMVSCKCPKGLCRDGTNCSCRRARLHCTPGCKPCRGSAALGCRYTLEGGEDEDEDDI